MATILNDKELKKLFGKVIKDADKSCVRPNSYILRLGSNGEFINTREGFKLEENKGIRLAPGHAVGITALETMDFSHDTVSKIFPECDLHGFLSPTTDLSREGLIAPSTQIDSGYKGTLNWTIMNTSGKTAEFVYGENLFRMTIVRLEKGERPELPYQGDYQEKQGYVPSRRRGAPKGMKESDWKSASVDGGPEEKLEELINSGYPWDILGAGLKTVTNKYADIKDSIDGLSKDVSRIKDTILGTKDITDLMEDTLRNQEDRLTDRLTDRLMSQIIKGFVGSIATSVGILSIATSLPKVSGFIMNNLPILGTISFVVGIVLIISFIIKMVKK